MTSPPRNRGSIKGSAAEQERRDQEVLRANRELAAYFRGRRTEREARAALKIIKAFVRNRERGDARSLPPLPGAVVAKTPAAGTPLRRSTGAGERRRKKPRSKKAVAPIPPDAELQPPQSPDSDERSDE